MKSILFNLIVILWIIYSLIEGVLLQIEVGKISEKYNLDLYASRYYKYANIRKAYYNTEDNNLKKRLRNIRIRFIIGNIYTFTSFILLVTVILFVED